MDTTPPRDVNRNEKHSCNQPTTQKEYSKHRHDIKAKERYFEIGDKVLVFSPVITGKHSEKLCDRWQGPYSVIGKVTTVIYLVDMPGRHKRHRTVHIEAIKAWIEPTTVGSSQPNSVGSETRNPRL